MSNELDQVCLEWMARGLTAADIVTDLAILRDCLRIAIHLQGYTDEHASGGRSSSSQEVLDLVDSLDDFLSQLASTADACLDGCADMEDWRLFTYEVPPSERHAERCLSLFLSGLKIMCRGCHFHGIAVEEREAIIQFAAYDLYKKADALATLAEGDSLSLIGGEAAMTRWMQDQMDIAARALMQDALHAS
jgi:hypothetical protein